jgi:general stress protein 26
VAVSASALHAVQLGSYAKAGRSLLASWPADRSMDEQALGRYLERRRYCVLATVTPAGAPQARPVAFCLVDGALWFATVGGARLRNVRADPRVSVVIAEGEGREHAMVLAEGAVEIHEDAATRERLTRAWREQQGSTPGWAVAFLELRPERVYSYLAAGAGA